MTLQPPRAGRDIVLVPGFWLDATSWSGVVPPLVEAGHRVHPLTLPGLDAPGSSRAGTGLREHVDAVVARVARWVPGSCSWGTPVGR